jgi:hypothetical protein
VDERTLTGKGRKICRSPDAHPYILNPEFNNDSVYYWCEKHAPPKDKVKRITPEEALVFEVLKK